MKDPAFLFYSSDFLTGTMLMTMEQKGKYITLLCLQHQKGHLTEKDMLNICLAYDEDIWNKFQKDKEGLFYNARLRSEIERRKAYSESRRQNRTKKNISSTYVLHMENENENEIVDRKKRGAGEKKPSIEDVKDFFREKGYSQDTAVKAFEYYSINEWKDGNGKPVKNWKQKMIAVWFKPENLTKKSSTEYATLT
ncbi:MAG: hypothetical protein ACK5XN_29990 [Bacteroidota bacterium]|jgi:hypothetical protein